MHPEYERSLWTIAARPDPSGYLRGMIVRRRQATAALVVAALLTSGCGSPAAPPTPDPTASSSSPVDDDAAAFAAAEATYRAYVDALNAVDLSDPATFEPVYALTTGRILESDRKALTDYNASGITMTGQTEIENVYPGVIRTDVTELFVCIDVSSVTLADPDGRSMVPSDRAPIQQMLVTARPDSTSPTNARLVDVVSTVDGPTCG